MLKAFIFSLIATCLFFSAHAQKTFNLTLRFDSTINPKKIIYTYYDGKSLAVASTVGSAKVAVISNKYYSGLVSIRISYIPGPTESYSNDFFIGDKPADITLHCQPNADQRLEYTSIKNATLVFDSLDNKRWGRIMNMRRNDPPKIAAAYSDFIARHPDYNKNDSLKNIFIQYFKAYMRQDMSYLKQYPNDYYSFWFFINQTAQLNSFLRNDRPFLQEQLTFAKTTFPAKYLNSAEGRYMAARFEKKIKAMPLKLNEPVPVFAITGIDGKKISLSDLKGKYVLLDFWATWCGPCMAELPFIKQISQKYPPEKLAIIGISLDQNKNAWLKTIAEKGMNWPQFLDTDRKICNPYNVDVIPTLVLIDKQGKLVYQSDHTHWDVDILPGMLTNIN